ncbi:hypothetical protein HU200_063064 [Digitaria exilis]|uniref:Exostosin GT47 domain-containing protein n=1 Tax=Digitaria exilis TaxID=1010633 RepID=A0A835AC50_9POAL|nr:hypothetical protein HU200_063064 [Digitaria exilis]
METNSPKYFLCGLFILGSWLLTFLLHFNFHHSFHLFSDETIVALLSTFNKTSFFPVVTASWPSTSSSSSCDGRYVHMLDLPPRFHVCAEGSPSSDSEYSICPLMSNGGLGMALRRSGNESDGETNIYALEVIFHNRMRQYECLTDDPTTATAVYVPYYPALELHPHLGVPPVALVATFLGDPRRRDHFMVASKATWMFRRKEPSDDQGCGNSFLEQPESRNMTVLTYETDIWERPRRGYFPVPYPSYFHPSSAGEVATWQARVRATSRPWLFAFAGARRPNGTLPIRDRIFDACDGSDGRCAMLDCGGGHVSCRRSPWKVVSLFVSSRFCLQPPGDSFMRRSAVDAVMAGCIPVFFHEASTFEKQYRWHDRDDLNSDGHHRSYYVFVDQNDVLQGKVGIEEVLSRYSDEEVAAMREEVIKMIPRFLYKDPTVGFDGGTRDAFDISMDEVLARMRRIKDGELLGGKDGNDD